jgi:hypothetical protein
MDAYEYEIGNKKPAPYFSVLCFHFIVASPVIVIITLSSVFSL